MDKTQLGFGAYRISIRSKEHREALTAALEAGCPLIDTSSNYTDGESEALIGEVLEKTGKKPLLISKVGYIQGNNLEVIKELNADGKATEDLVVINEHLKHSIHPDFIRNQLERTLKRLGVSQLDAYLLHNPEYYLKTKDSNKEDYYRRIQDAFNCLEEMVAAGKIKSYGVSSNTLVDPKDDHESTDLDRLYQAAKAVNDNHHFKYIQFPLNLIELGALERQYNGLTLLEKATELGLKTMINRPFNAFSSQGFIRLANYEIPSDLTDEMAGIHLQDKLRPLQAKWDEQKEPGDEDLYEVSFMQQFRDIWYKQKTPDGVEQLFYQYFFPFIAQVWGGDLSVEESQPFYDLFDLAIAYSRRNMNELANQFKKQAQKSGLLPNEDTNLTDLAIDKYKSMGVDYILIGMKRPHYVNNLKKYF
jgi:aryl-alcohol dehydrogenase-like predicted oxidoreductase